MKPKFLLKWLTLLMYCSLPILVLADDTKLILTGHGMKTEDSVAKSEAIFIGKITDLGLPSLKAEGQAKYWGLKITIIEILKGRVDSNAKFLMTVQNDQAEISPQLNTAYIFYVKDEPNRFTKIIKMEEATSSNITKVKALIAAAPTH